MQRSLKYFIGFTFLIFIIAHIGFYKKYIALFPSFDGVSWVTHYHATLMFGWLALLIVQPFLILKNKTYWHKIIGKASYLIAPLLVVSMFLITNQGFRTKLKSMSLPEAYASLAVNISDFFAFSILYGLALYYKKYTDFHARYMIATSLPIMGAAIVRVMMRYFEIPKATAFDAVQFLAEGVCLIFILLDVRSKKYQPYLITLFILVVEHGIYSLRFSEAWQTFAHIYVSLFIK